MSALAKISFLPCAELSGAELKAAITDARSLLLRLERAAHEAGNISAAVRVEAAYLTLKEAEEYVHE